jgi:hypothetical protein
LDLFFQKSPPSPLPPFFNNQQEKGFTAFLSSLEKQGEKKATDGRKKIKRENDAHRLRGGDPALLRRSGKAGLI